MLGSCCQSDLWPLAQPFHEVAKRNRISIEKISYIALDKNLVPYMILTFFYLPYLTLRFIFHSFLYVPYLTSVHIFCPFLDTSISLAGISHWKDNNEIE
jgi:hypothetical protein